MNAKELAIAFHDIYERLAPSFGYETRLETRRFDENSANGRLMIAVCNEILSPTCRWRLYDEYEEPWQGGCGILWVFTDAGTPQEHGVNFCPRCGRSVLVVEDA